MRDLGQTMERHGYQATFIKIDERDRFALLFSVHTDTRIFLCDHLWTRTGDWCRNLAPGSVIQFTAVPIKYVKRHGHTTGELEVDITLSDVEDVKKVSEIALRKEINEFVEKNDEQERPDND